MTPQGDAEMQVAGLHWTADKPIAKASAFCPAQVPQAPPDPILGISEAFKASASPDKLNLGVGAYRTEELKPLVLNVVKKVGAFCTC